MTASIPEIVYPEGFAEKAKEFFSEELCPNKELRLKLHQAIADGKGEEVGKIINEITGAGYVPSPAKIVELINEDRVDEIRAEAVKYRDWSKFYSWWAKIFNDHYTVKSA